MFLGGGGLLCEQSQHFFWGGGGVASFRGGRLPVPLKGPPGNPDVSRFIGGILRCLYAYNTCYN